MTVSKRRDTAQYWIRGIEDLSMLQEKRAQPWYASLHLGMEVPVTVNGKPRHGKIVGIHDTPGYALTEVEGVGEVPFYPDPPVTHGETDASRRRAFDGYRIRNGLFAVGMTIPCPTTEGDVTGTVTYVDDWSYRVLLPDGKQKTFWKAITEAESRDSVTTHNLAAMQNPPVSGKKG